jgi:hypothetical protein
MHRKGRFLAATSLLAAALITGRSTLAAQQPERTRVPVTIALVDELPDPTALFVILRRADATPADVILLRTGAGPQQLSAAVQALRMARRQGGDQAFRDAMLRARPHQDDRARNARPLPWAPQVIADLHRAARREVPGVGSVQSVQIWLPRSVAAGQEPAAPPRRA